jgi:HEAT repeat protein
MIGELSDERVALEEALRQVSPFMPWIFEHTTAESLPLPEAYLRRVRECDLFVLLVSENVSRPVVVESETALANHKPILTFVRRGQQSAEAADFIYGLEQLGAFKYAAFDGPDDLADLAVQAVLQELTDRHRDYWHAVAKGYLPPPNVNQIIQSYAAEIITNRIFADWQDRYTPLRAIADLPLHYQARERPPSQHRRTSHIRDYTDLRLALNDYLGMLLVGEPGAGKTTSLQRIALDRAVALRQDPESLVPIYLPLGGYTPARSLSTYLGDQLRAAVLETIQGPQPANAHRQLADYLEALRQEGRLLLLLDGLNELRQVDRAQALDEVRRFTQLALSNGCKVVVTCRPDDYMESGGLAGLTEVRVQELSDRGIEFFLRAHLGRRSADLLGLLRADRRGILELARNPYRLWMIQAIYAEHHELPTNRALLFQKMVSWLLRRQAEVSGQAEPEAWFDANVIQAVLARLAYAMLADPDIFTVAPLNWVDDQLQGRELVRGRWVQYEPRRVLSLARAARLTVEREPSVDRMQESGVLRFTHQLLQEYFAAAHLSSLGFNHPNVLNCLQNDVWDEVLILLAGLTPQLDRLMAQLLPLDPLLAARCANVRLGALSSETTHQLVAILSHLAYNHYNPWRKKAITTLGRIHLDASLPALMRLASNQPVDIRRCAILALGELGAPESVPTLVAQLQDENGDVRRAAATALDRLGAKASFAFLLEELREEKDEDTWLIVAEAVGQLEIQEAVPVLVERLQSENTKIRESASIALGKLRSREPVPDLIELLWDADPSVRRAAALALGELGAREAIPFLVRRLGEVDRKERQAIGETLVRLWTRQDMSYLIELLGNENRNVREIAIVVLGKRGAREAGPALIDSLGDENRYVRRAAASALGELQVREAIPILNERLRHENRKVRRVVLEALRRLWTQDNIPYLVEQLRDENPVIRQAAAAALGQLGAREAVPSLLELLRDENRKVRRAASDALGKLRTEEDIPDLIERLEHRDRGVRWAAAKTLGRMGARQAVPILIESLQDKDTGIRRNAAEILAKLKAREAVPAFIERLWDENALVRQVAAEALGILRAQEAIPSLVQQLGDENQAVRQTAAVALGKLGAGEVIPALVLSLLEAQQSEGYYRHYGPRQALVALPPRLVLPALRPFLAYPDPVVRSAILPVYEEIRQRAVLPREPLVFQVVSPAPDGILLRRAALWAVITVANDVIALVPGWSTPVWRKGEALRRLGCSDAALETFAFVFDTSSPEVQRRAGHDNLQLEAVRCLNQRGRQKVGLDLIHHIQVRAGDNLSILVECAILLEELGVFSETEALYARIIQQEDRTSYLHSRAGFLIRQSRYAEAEMDIARVAEREPWHPDTYARRGQLALASGYYAEALAAFEDAAIRDPHTVQWRYDVAFARLALRQHRQAMMILEEILARTELHEELEAALQDLALLERAVPNLPGLADVRARVLARRELLDRLAEEECARMS